MKTRVEWLPVEVERLRATCRADVPAPEAERLLHLEPERLLRAAYPSVAIGDRGASVALRPAMSLPWPSIPAWISLHSPGPGHESSLISISWRPQHLARLLPELDGDVMLDKRDVGSSELRLEATYRPPLGLVGLVFDHVAGRRIAASTVAAFVSALAAALEELLGSAPGAPAGA